MLKNSETEIVDGRWIIFSQNLWIYSTLMDRNHSHTKCTSSQTKKIILYRKTTFFLYIYIFFFLLLLVNIYNQKLLKSCFVSAKLFLFIFIKGGRCIEKCLVIIWKKKIDKFLIFLLNNIGSCRDWNELLKHSCVIHHCLLLTATRLHAVSTYFFFTASVCPVSGLTSKFEIY